MILRETASILQPKITPGRPGADVAPPAAYSEGAYARAQGFCSRKQKRLENGQLLVERVSTRCTGRKLLWVKTLGYTLRYPLDSNQYYESLVAQSDFVTVWKEIKTE